MPRSTVRKKPQAGGPREHQEREPLSAKREVWGRLRRGSAVSEPLAACRMGRHRGAPRSRLSEHPQEQPDAAKQWQRRLLPTELGTDSHPPCYAVLTSHSNRQPPYRQRRAALDARPVFRCSRSGLLRPMPSALAPFARSQVSTGPQPRVQPPFPLLGYMFSRVLRDM